jgi:hypothetical protein
MATERGIPHSKYPHVWVIIRQDQFPVEDFYMGISAVKVYESEEEAVQETARLNKINGDKHCKCWLFQSRFHASPNRRK